MKKSLKILLITYLIVCVMPIEPSNTTWDTYGTRYQLVKQTPGKYNWLFVPGGPGADSCYFLPLIEKLELPGKIWLIDLPANGTNKYKDSMEFPFDKWGDCLVEAVKQFDNPIYVGHSFGAMLPFTKPDIESLLTGMIILGSAPTNDPAEAQRLVKQKNIQISLEDGIEFRENPNAETFKKALVAGAARHFPSSTLDKGKTFFRNLPFNYLATLWWIPQTYKAKWAPKKIPTLIIGGKEDCINPVVLFEKDPLFQRNNISIYALVGAGHFPWMEKQDEIIDLFAVYYDRLSHIK